MDDISIEKPNPEIISDAEKPADDGSKTDSKSTLIVIGIIIGIVLLTIGGFALYNNITGKTVQTLDDLHQDNLDDKLDEKEGYVYNGFSFVYYDGLWWTIIKNQAGQNLKVPLRFAPKELEDIPIEGKLNPEFNDGENVYVAINPTTQNKYYTVAISELSLNLAQGLQRIPVGSCTEENEICFERPIINCETAGGKPVIELAITPEKESSIELRGSCIKLSGNDIDIVKAVDRLLYQWYKVMK